MSEHPTLQGVPSQHPVPLVTRVRRPNQKRSLDDLQAALRFFNEPPRSLFCGFATAKRAAALVTFYVQDSRSLVSLTRLAIFRGSRSHPDTVEGFPTFVPTSVGPALPRPSS